MTHPSRRLFLATPAATLLARSTAPAPAPLFRDPIYDGASDPVAIWNRHEKNWWLLYTQRRANVDGPGVARVHGCDIGVARSTDDGHSWRYLGVLPGLEYERGRNIFWAPEIVWHEGTYHMYASYVPGVPREWSGARGACCLGARRSTQASITRSEESASGPIAGACGTKTRTTT